MESPERAQRRRTPATARLSEQQQKEQRRKPFADLTNSHSKCSPRPSPSTDYRGPEKEPRGGDPCASLSTPAAKDPPPFLNISSSNFRYNLRVRKPTSSFSPLVPQEQRDGPSAPSSMPTAEEPSPSSIGDDAIDLDKSKCSIVYKRHVAAASSCPPMDRVRATKRKLLIEDTIADQPKAFSVPFKKPKKKQRFVAPEALGKPMLPQDFIDKQRAYFAEIDAFELPEEEVSESDLE